MSIGKFLTKFREKSGLSQIEVAKRMGLSVKSGRKYISRLETNKLNSHSLTQFLSNLMRLVRGN